MLNRKPIFIGWVLFHAHIALGTLFNPLSVSSGEKFYMPKASRNDRQLKAKQARPTPSETLPHVPEASRNDRQLKAKQARPTPSETLPHAPKASRNDRRLKTKQIRPTPSGTSSLKPSDFSSHKPLPRRPLHGSIKPLVPFETLPYVPKASCDDPSPKAKQVRPTPSETSSLKPSDFSSRKPLPRSPFRRLTEPLVPLETILVPHVQETWIDPLTEEEMQALDRAFPHLGFGLAGYIAQLEEKSTQEVFGDSLTDFNQQSGSCRNMKKGKFQGKPYVLKPKNSMGLWGSRLEASYRNARNEIEVGARIRQAVVNVFFNNGRNLDTMQAEFDFLFYLVAPIDCGDYIASLEIPNAMSLYDIVYAKRRQFSSSAAIQLFGDVPAPIFDADDGDSIPRSTLFPNINFGQAEERIRAAQNMIKILQFLHANGIAQNDLHPGNFLIQNNDYTRLSLIDFDKATWGQRFSLTNDRKDLVNVMIEYLLGITREILPAQIDFSCLDDPETFFYTAEEIDLIKKMLLTLR